LIRLLELMRWHWVVLRSFFFVAAEFDTADHRHAPLGKQKGPSAGGRLRNGDRNAKGGRGPPIEHSLGAFPRPRGSRAAVTMRPSARRGWMKARRAHGPQRASIARGDPVAFAKPLMST